MDKSIPTIDEMITKCSEVLAVINEMIDICKTCERCSIFMKQAVMNANRKHDQSSIQR
jgi:predicted nucleic acid-binding Zn ribbon protein